MGKPDEIALARAMLTYDPHPDTGEGQPLHVRMGIPAKRWEYIVAKWKRRGWIELAGSTPQIEYPAFNYTGYRYWSNAVATCDAPKDYCIVTDDIGRYCPYVQHDNRGAYVYVNGAFSVRECVLPFLEE